MDSPNISYDFKSASKPFSRIGFALILFFVATHAAQGLFFFAAEIVSPGWTAGGVSYAVQLAISAVTMYLVGFPVFYFTIRGIDTAPPVKKKCGAGTVGAAFLISVALMYVGQIVGDLACSTLYDLVGISATSATIEFINHLKWYEALAVTALIGPLFEELMFRKLIIDRTRMYGEKLSMIFSALMFAFFHTNMQQFFYAFLVGLLYAYLYLRRGKVFYSWILHALFNFFCSVLPLILYEFVDMNAFMSAESTEELYKLVDENILGYGLVSLYSLATIAMAIVGFNILLRKQRKALFLQTSLQLPKDSEATVAFLNIGVILFILFSVAYPFIISYI